MHFFHSVLPNPGDKRNLRFSHLAQGHMEYLRQSFCFNPEVSISQSWPIPSPRSVQQQDLGTECVLNSGSVDIRQDAQCDPEGGTKSNTPSFFLSNWGGNPYTEDQACKFFFIRLWNYFSFESLHLFTKLIYVNGTNTWERKFLSH